MTPWWRKEPQPDPTPVNVHERLAHPIGEPVTDPVMLTVLRKTLESDSGAARAWSCSCSTCGLSVVLVDEEVDLS